MYNYGAVCACACVHACKVLTFDDVGLSCDCEHNTKDFRETVKGQK